MGFGYNHTQTLGLQMRPWLAARQGLAQQAGHAVPKPRTCWYATYPLRCESMLRVRAWLSCSISIGQSAIDEVPARAIAEPPNH